MKAYCCKERDGDEYAVIVYGKQEGKQNEKGLANWILIF